MAILFDDIVYFLAQSVRPVDAFCEFYIDPLLIVLGVRELLREDHRDSN